jgi:hypothetical protein
VKAHKRRSATGSIAHKPAAPLRTGEVSQKALPGRTEHTNGRTRITRLLTGAALVCGFIAAGGLAGFGARWWIGGVNGQRAQLHECVVASQRAHPNEAAGKMLPYLQVEVPACMEAAGYATALDDRDCDRTLWQGNVYCYSPKSWSGALLFRIVTLL